MEKWHRFLGIRPSEAKTVGLFFAHNFLLGTATILVYVAANVLLLENHPERNLPLAYCLGALGTMAVGQLYAHYEHRLPLEKLAVRALAAAAVLTLVLGLLILLGPGVATAVAVMTGYRLIYLLTNLEFWGLSAVVFNVRQGRRLFSIISSGDMAAKALGAVLTFFVSAHNELYLLLLAAFGTYGLALLVQRAAFRAQDVAARPGTMRPGRPAAAAGARQLLGTSPLVRAMGFGLTTIAAAAAGVEYFFFINVKVNLQDQATILRYVGGVLTLTYLLAMPFKLLLARWGLDWLGVRWSLAVLPGAALAGTVGFGLLQAAGVSALDQLLYFCGLYLGLEVLRRAVFEPVFLVLFQPLTPQERLEGHTLVKGFYEPLGLGVGGLLLFALHHAPALSRWVPLVWMALLLLGALFLLQHAYWKYIDELKAALGLRFAVAPVLSVPGALPTLPNSATQARTREAFQAVAQLRKANARSFREHAADLLTHPNSLVRNRVLGLVGGHTDAALLCRLALADPDPALREMASRLAGRHPEADDLLRHPDVAVRRGALRGRLEAAPADALAHQRLTAELASTETGSRLVALALVGFLAPAQQQELVISSLQSSEPALVQAAVQAAACTTNPALIKRLIGLLSSKATRKPAQDSLVRLGAAGLPALKEALADALDERHLQRLANVCAALATPAARQLLVSVVQSDCLPGRAAALRALAALAAVPADAPLFHRLVEQELRLAQQLLHGMMTANAELRAALRYELRKGQQRVFGLLMQVYERQPLIDAQRGVLHATCERQANALEMLDNLIPRPLYRGLQALLDVGRLSDKVLTFDNILGPFPDAEPIQATIVRRGQGAFSAWTIGVALRQWHPQPATVVHLYPHLQAPHLLIRESAWAVLRRLPLLRPAAYDQLLTQFPAIGSQLMNTPAATASATAQERVQLLKGTALFAETPENVLATIIPIMREVAFEPEEGIFVKGTLGTSLFIVCEGEVGIFNGAQPLATFRKGDFFGELALLDAEPRSATALALSRVVTFRLDQEDFYDVMEERSEVLRNILRVLCQRLRRQNEKTQVLP